MVGTQTFQIAGLSLGAYGSLGTETNPVFFTHTDNLQYSTNAFRYTTGTIPGFTNNFGLGALSVQNASTLLLMDNVLGGPTAGLYVATLSLDIGSRLIISNNLQLYFKTTNGVTGLAFGSWDDNLSANVLLLEGAGFHGLVIPEPSTLLLLMAGSLAIWRWRRRATSSKANHEKTL